MTQEITVLNKQVRLLQPENGFKTSIDAVILAAACPVKSGEGVLDLGCGVGSAGLCLAHRVPNISLRGVDIQENHIDIARQNAKLNDRTSNTEFMTSDMRLYKHEAGFHHVVCNPPYLETGDHLRSPHSEKAMAMGHDNDVSTKDWVHNASRLLKPQGGLTMVHEAGKADKIIQAMEGRFGAIEIIPLWPKAGRQAKRVIIRAIKGRKTPLSLHSGIILHDDQGGYTLEADKILRDGEGLFL